MKKLMIVAMAIGFITGIISTSPVLAHDAAQVCREWSEEDDYYEYFDNFGDCIAWIETWPVEHCKEQQDDGTSHFADHHKNLGKCISHHRPFLDPRQHQGHDGH
jgi:hypothetical protein